MLVLGIDTATQTGGVALLDQEALRGEYLLNVSVTHSERLMRSIQMLMRDSHISGEDITGIAVSLGPGSFTGLRIGVTVAKTLAWVWGCPLVGVSTLKALAIQGAGGELLCPLIDARRENVYAAVYSADFQPVLDPHYTSLTELTDFFQNQGKTVVFLGDAVLRHRETLLDKLPGLPGLRRYRTFYCDLLPWPMWVWRCSNRAIKMILYPQTVLFATSGGGTKCPFEAS